MKLRLTMSSRRSPPRQRLALLGAVALGLLSLGQAPNVASAATGDDYSSTILYLSGTQSAPTVLGANSFQLVTSPTPVGGAPPVTSNRIKLGDANKYQEFQPGIHPLVMTANTPTATASAVTTPSNKGWIVDGPGGVSFPPYTWYFTTNVAEQTQGTPAPAATLAVGMWIVTVSGGVITTSTMLVDPNCTVLASCTPGAVPGDASPGTNFISVSGGAVTVTLPVSLAAISLAYGQHLYVQYWRHQSVAYTSTGDANHRVATMSVNDGVAQITHPAANAFPDVPVLDSIATPTNTPPSLSATFSDPDLADKGTLGFQWCKEPCNIGTQTIWSVSNIDNGQKGTLPLSGLTDGTYDWRVQATDSFSANNVSDWSATSSFVVDTTKPTVSNITASNPDGAYKAGDIIHVRVGLTEPVNVTGVPTLALNTSPARSATYVSGTGTSTLTFDYTVQAGDNAASLDFTGTGALAPSGGTIADPATNNATLTLPSPGAAGSLAANTNLVIDTVAPTAGATTASNANGPYTTGQTIHVQVGFSEPVTVTGNPTVALNTTPARSAAYVSGTGTATLTFDYVVQAGDNVTTLDYTGTGALSLGGGTIADLAGNAATLTLASPGAAGSLSANRSLRIDTNPPGTSNVGGPADASDLDAVPTLSAKFVDSDVGDTGNLDFQVCSDAACTSVVQSSSPGSLTNGASRSWTPSGLPDGVYYWRIGAHDAVGNQSAWPATQGFTLDTTPPSGPTSGGAVAGALVTAAPTLAATYTDATSGGVTGLLVFEVCTTSTCTTVVESTTVAGLHQNDAASWVPPGLGDGTYYWHVRAEDSAGNLSPWSDVRSFSIDGTPPPAPVPSSPPGQRVHAAPQLGAIVIEPGNPGDSSRLLVELCTDPDCTSIVTTGYSGVVSVDTAAGWQAPALPDGVYYWRARAEDAAGNQSPWSAVASFVVDTVPPAVPVQGAPADGAIVNTPHLSGVPGTSESGVAFQVCADADCANVLTGGYAFSLPTGAAPSWTPTGLADGTYFWRIAAHDAAGNASGWSDTKSFVLDQTPPGTPRGLQARVKGTTLTLHWLAPTVAHHLAGYAVFANGRRIRTLTLKTHTVRIQLRKSETRVFTVASFDAAGNVSRPTRQIAAVSLPLANRTARVAATPVAHRR